MPSFNYTALKAQAEKLLDKFGASGTLTRQAFTVADTTKPWARTATSSNTTVKMVLLPWGQADKGRYFGEDIIAGTSKAIILWGTVEPLPDDTVSYGGKTWTVKAATPINPAGTGLIHVCALAGGA